MQVPYRLVVHSGTFHADDVMCAVLLRMLNPDLEIVRTTGQDLNKHRGNTGILIADIGFGKYDHHQTDAACKPDGRKHAACGLVFKDFADQFVPVNEKAGRMFARLLDAVEDLDNGVPRSEENSVFTQIVRYSNPNWDSTDSPDEAFEACVKMLQENVVGQLLMPKDRTRTNARVKSPSEIQEWMETTRDELMIDVEASKERGREIVREALDKKHDHLVELDQFVPWQEVVCEDNDAWFIMYPSNREGYNVQAIPVEPGSFENKLKLPKQWVDNPPEGNIFTHPALFLAVFDTAEHARDAIEATIREYESDTIFPGEEPEMKTENNQESVKFTLALLGLADYPEYKDVFGKGEVVVAAKPAEGVYVNARQATEPESFDTYTIKEKDGQTIAEYEQTTNVKPGEWVVTYCDENGNPKTALDEKGNVRTNTWAMDEASFNKRYDITAEQNGAVPAKPLMTVFVRIPQAVSFHQSWDAQMVLDEGAYINITDMANGLDKRTLETSDGFSLYGVDGTFFDEAYTVHFADFGCAEEGRGITSASEPGLMTLHDELVRNLNADLQKIHDVRATAYETEIMNEYLKQMVEKNTANEKSDNETTLDFSPIYDFEK